MNVAFDQGRPQQHNIVAITSCPVRKVRVSIKIAKNDAKHTQYNAGAGDIHIQTVFAERIATFYPNLNIGQTSGIVLVINGMLNSSLNGVYLTHNRLPPLF